MLSPNYGTRTVPSLRGKSSGFMCENYPWIISGNYHWELWDREGWKARRVNPTLRLMPSANYGTHACKKGRGTRLVHSLRGKSSGIIFWELWPSKTWRRKVEIYIDTGVSKNLIIIDITSKRIHGHYHV